MRIVIDMQGAQTESRFRGIGRYIFGFVDAVVRNRGEHEVFLALSGLFPDTIEPIRTAFDDLLPQENIRVWYAPGPVMEGKPGNEARREVAELIREAFLVSLKPDVIHVCSLFEGYVDDAVTSIGRFDNQTPVTITLYDLIPLLNPTEYLEPNPTYAIHYGQKIEFLKRARALLAISEFARTEALQNLKLSDDSVVNVSTALDVKFSCWQIDSRSQRDIKRRLGITRSVVLYTGGADQRKNLPRLIQSYAALPVAVRAEHQLVLAGKMPDGDIARFKKLAKTVGLQSGELCFPGYVSDEELVVLYKLCALYVFPSLHEGFGLPALEAMACGAPVIGANTSSLPEVIGNAEALFDPLDVAAITAKMQQALTDISFRESLRTHGLRQAERFSWDETSKRTIAAWERLERLTRRSVSSLACKDKPRLAFVSPLPPERTGIANYSAELLPALAEHYEIELVVTQGEVEDPWVNDHGKVRDVAWLRKHAREIDRVLYQMGNSPFHGHMFSLLREIPGIVVLHDFYLSAVKAWQETQAGSECTWTRSLYDAHGYEAVTVRYKDPETAKNKYPVNFDILQHAHGVIVHSELSRRLAYDWYGETAADDWAVIPLVRTPVSIVDSREIKKQLGFLENDFLVCSFGFLDSTKLNHRLIQCWLNSSLAQNPNCHLVFVGENNGGDYGQALLQIIRDSSVYQRIHITGFVSRELFEHYLTATDLAVQLRAASRGETSAAVLDCMNHALPLIVNANGSIAELPDAAVWKLPDEFDDYRLIEALETLGHSPNGRRELGDRARQMILNRHRPEQCARQYADAIEYFHNRAKATTPVLIDALAGQFGPSFTDAELRHLASSVADTLPRVRPATRLFLDLTATIRNDLKTGIERVARALLSAFLENPPKGYRVEPVYLDQVEATWVYRYARRYTLGLLNCPEAALDDEIVDPACGDILLGIDLSGDALVQAHQAGLFARYRNLGVSVYSVIFDLLPVRMPQVFPPGADVIHQRWLKAVTKFDGAFCISQAVAQDLAQWKLEQGNNSCGGRPYQIRWFHLGADIMSTAPTKGSPGNAESIFAHCGSRPTFLMVGTIEPRKGYLQTIEAFNLLWADDLDVNLVIVGKRGWQHLPDNMRRDIPQVIDALISNPKFNQRLFWLEDVSDEFLDAIYGASTCLIAASFGEGFGLALIESAKHKLPIIARDIPVFREVAGDSAFYFKAQAAGDLACAIRQWVSLYERHEHPKSGDLRYVMWKESAKQLLACLERAKRTMKKESTCANL